MNLLTNSSEIERTVKRFMKIIGDPFTKIITDFSSSYCTNKFEVLY